MHCADTPLHLTTPDLQTATTSASLEVLTLSDGRLINCTW